MNAEAGMRIQLSSIELDTKEICKKCKTVLLFLLTFLLWKIVIPYKTIYTHMFIILI
jgi:hypothetical protein